MWEQTVVALCGVVPVSTIVPVFPAGTYRHYRRPLLHRTYSGDEGFLVAGGLVFLEPLHCGGVGHLGDESLHVLSRRKLTMWSGGEGGRRGGGREQVGRVSHRIMHGLGHLL